MAYVRSRPSWPAWPDPNSLIRSTDLENFDATLLAHDLSIAAIVGLPAAGGANRLPVWTGSLWVAQQIDNNQIAAAAGILGSKLQFSKSATPPGSPVDGDLWVLPVDATNGVNWLFRYNAGSASASKWEFVGGPALVTQVDTSNTLVSAAYAALAAAGPAVALPRAGDYDVELGCYMATSSATATVLMSYDIGATAAIDANGIEVDSAVANMGSSVWRRRRLTGFGAVTLTAKYRATAGTGTFANRYLSVTPVRVS